MTDSKTGLGVTTEVLISGIDFCKEQARWWTSERVAVVTGGGRGIGRGIVLALAELGFTLVVNYRSDRESAESTCREAEARGSPRCGRVPRRCRRPGRRSPAARNDDRASRAGRPVGQQRRDRAEQRLDLLETTPESWDRVLTTNLRGPFFLTQAVARSDDRASCRPERSTEPQIVFITLDFEHVSPASTGRSIAWPRRA